MILAVWFESERRPETDGGVSSTNSSRLPSGPVLVGVQLPNANSQRKLLKKEIQFLFRLFQIDSSTTLASNTPVQAYEIWINRRKRNIQRAAVSSARGLCGSRELCTKKLFQVSLVNTCNCFFFNKKTFLVSLTIIAAGDSIEVRSMERISHQPALCLSLAEATKSDPNELVYCRRPGMK